MQILNSREKVISILCHCLALIIDGDHAVLWRTNRPQKKFAPLKIVIRYRRKTSFDFRASPIGRFSSSILSSISRGDTRVSGCQGVSGLAATIGLPWVSKKYLCPLRVGNVSKHPIPLHPPCSAIKMVHSRPYTECIFRPKNVARPNHNHIRDPRRSIILMLKIVMCNLRPLSKFLAAIVPDMRRARLTCDLARIQSISRD